MYERLAVLRTAARVAAEGAVLAAAFAVVVGAIFRDRQFVVAARVGIGAAWAASTFSVAWLLWAKRTSPTAFWWAFGGGMALRAAVLGAVALWALRTSAVLEAALVAYVFALLGMLLTLELRHLKVQ